MTITEERTKSLRRNLEQRLRPGALHPSLCAVHGDAVLEILDALDEARSSSELQAEARFACRRERDEAIELLRQAGATIAADVVEGHDGLRDLSDRIDAVLGRSR